MLQLSGVQWKAWLVIHILIFIWLSLYVSSRCFFSAVFCLYAKKHIVCHSGDKNDQHRRKTGILIFGSFLN